MIRLCIDGRITGAVGIGRFIRQLVPLLNRPPFHITLLVNHKGEDWCKDLEQVVFGAPIYSMREQFLFPIRIPKCDLFWSPHYNVPILPIFAKKRVVTIHDTCHLRYARFFPFYKRKAARFIMKKAFYHSDCVTTVSEFSKKELQHYFGKEKEIHTISLGVDHVQERVSSQTEEEIRLKYRLFPRFLLFVGNLLPHKNYQVLLEVVSKLSIPDLGLVIIGKGKRERTNPRTIFLGQVSDEELLLLYKMAELFVFPSLYEGFGFPPLEAMMVGCPTLVSLRGSLPEVCGSASIYFDPNDSEELARLILKIIDDKDRKEQLIQMGKIRAKKFIWAETGRKYRELFEKVALA